MSKVISKDDLSAYQRWELPAVEGKPSNYSLLTAKQVELIQKQAYDEGFALGKKEGFASGQAQLKEELERLKQLIASLNEPLTGIDKKIEEELVLLAMTMARQIVRREIKLDPGSIISVAREAINSLPAASRNINLHLHPQDAALVREALALTEGERVYRVVEDPALQRGDCRVASDPARIDATVEARLIALMVAALGGERRDDKFSR